MMYPFCVPMRWLAVCCVLGAMVVGGCGKKSVIIDREDSTRVVCAGNLRRIGQGFMMYAKDHPDAQTYPSDWGVLVNEQDTEPGIFLCPAAHMTLPRNLKNKSLAEQAQWVRANSDYVYVGAGKPLKSADKDMLIAYDKLNNHNGRDGINMLFGDGHVEWEWMDNAKKIIAAGHKLPPATAKSSTQQAVK